MFVTKCFIRKYTPELFLRVMDMGYDVCGPDPKSDVIECGNNTCCAYKLPFDGHLMSYVDCGTNEDMFLSLAAMNDESLASSTRCSMSAILASISGLL